MIRIRKPAQLPTILRSKGTRKCAEHCAAYDNGEREFVFDASIYGAKAVKDALVAAQHGKCCFCESKVGHDGDVEHFRPKSACCQGRGKAMLRPGYYWLAYEWKNLFLCCSACNSRYKRNYFPLREPEKRSRSHQDDLTQEDPLFINPAERDPEQFISFRQEIAYAIDGNAYGKTTIDALNLNRENFNERRRERLADLVTMREIIALEHTDLNTTEGRPLVAKAKAILSRAIADNAEFAAMSRAAAREDFYFSP